MICIRRSPSLVLCWQKGQLFSEDNLFNCPLSLSKNIFLGPVLKSNWLRLTWSKVNRESPMMATPHVLGLSEFLYSSPSSPPIRFLNSLHEISPQLSWYGLPIFPIIFSIEVVGSNAKISMKSIWILSCPLILGSLLGVIKPTLNDVYWFTFWIKGMQALIKESSWSLSKSIKSCRLFWFSGRR